MVIITGILVFVTMVAIGAAVKYGKQYWLIAGYNTLPKEKQKEVDIEGLAGFMGNCAFILGAFFLAGSVASSLWYAKLFPAVILVYTGGVFYMAIRAQRFVRREKTKGEKRASTFSMAATLLILCGVGAVIIYGQASPQVEVKAEGIVIGGLYGTTIPAEKIREVSLENEIPRIIYRNNGLGYGEIKKGYFTLRPGPGPTLPGIKGRAVHLHPNGGKLRHYQFQGPCPHRGPLRKHGRGLPGCSRAIGPDGFY
jgi:hypothetical protein